MKTNSIVKVLWTQRRGRWTIRCEISPIGLRGWETVVWKRHTPDAFLMVRERFRSRAAAETRGLALRRGGWK